MTKYIAFPGQSLNQELWWLPSDTVGLPTPSASTYMWNGSGWVAPAGRGLITFCNIMSYILGDEIKVFPAAVGGSSLHVISADPSHPYNCWSSTLVGNPLSAFYKMIDDSGCTPDLLIWNQGQQDYYATTDTQYKSALTTLYNGILTKCGKTSTQMPIVVFISNSAPYGVNGAYIRRGQIDWVASTANAYLGPAHYDLPRRSDQTHLTPDGYVSLAKRAAAAALAALGGPQKHLGPKIISGVRGGNGNQIRISIDNQQIAGIWQANPWNNPTGWRVWNAAGSVNINVDAAVICGSDSIRLDLAGNPGANCLVAYQWDDSASTSGSNYICTNTNPFAGTTFADIYGLPMQPSGLMIVA